MGMFWSKHFGYKTGIYKFTRILELYASNELIVWYINDTSIKLLGHEKKSDHERKFP